MFRQICRYIRLSNDKEVIMFRFANMLVLKVTRDCNLRCSYCYIKNKDHFKGEVMDFGVYKEVINRIVADRRTISEQEKPGKFELVFHGGEPTKIGYDNLARMLEYAEVMFNQNGINYGFGIQTNMTLLDKDMLSLFHKYNVSIGASFDGIKGGMEGRSKIVSEQKFIDKIKMVQDSGVEIGFLLVANQANIDVIEESKNFMVKELDTNSVKINYSEDVNIAETGIDTEISGEEYYEKVIKVLFEIFLKDKSFNEENILLLIRKFITNITSNDRGLTKYNCYGKICGGGINIVEMNPNGEVYFCGRYSEDYEEAYLMNYQDTNFLALRQIKRYTDFVEAKHKAILETGCDNCYADGICDHGCMAFHFSKFGKWGIRKDLVCPIFKRAYQWMAKHQVEIVEAFERQHGFPYRLNPYYPIQTINTNTKFARDLSSKGISINIIDGMIEFNRMKDEFHNN